MASIDRLSLYKEFYFSQISERESIEKRLQLVFAIEVTFVGVIGVLVNGVCKGFGDFSQTLFWFMTLVSIVSLSISIVLFIRAYWGYEYKMMPFSNQIESYRDTLIRTYESYEDGDKLADAYFQNFLTSYFATWSSHNASVNDYRGLVIYRCVQFIIVALVPLAIGLGLFAFDAVERVGDGCMLTRPEE